MSSRLARELCRALFSPSLPFSEREHLAETAAALFAGANLQDGLREVLLERFESGDEDDRVIAALALGAPGDEKVIAALERGLSDSSVRVRLACGRTLGEIAVDTAGEAIVEALERAAHPGERVGLLASLRRTEHRCGRDALVGALADEEIETQLVVLGCLSQAPCARTLPEARRLLGSPDARVRSLAVAILERAGEGSDLAAVQALVEDDDGRVRAIARDAARVLERRGTARS